MSRATSQLRTMRIRVYSDLHLEFEGFEPPHTHDVDIVVLAVNRKPAPTSTASSAPSAESHAEASSGHH